MEPSTLMKKLASWTGLLMWPALILAGVGLIGRINRIDSWSDLPLLTRTSLIAAGILFLISTAMAAGVAMARRATHNRIRATGRPAEATILQITDTRQRTNYSPVVRFRLKVCPPDEPPFEAEAERLVPQLEIPRVQPGAVVPVKYDPGSRIVVMMEDDSPSFSSS